MKGIQNRREANALNKNAFYCTKQNAQILKYVPGFIYKLNLAFLVQCDVQTQPDIVYHSVNYSLLGKFLVKHFVFALTVANPLGLGLSINVITSCVNAIQLYIRDFFPNENRSQCVFFFRKRQIQLISCLHLNFALRQTAVSILA